MAHATNGRHTDNWWLETLGSAVSQDAAGLGSTSVVGNSASSATDSGNPVKVGGVFNTSPATLTSGQRGDLQVTSKGSLIIAAEYKNRSAVSPIDSLSNSINAIFDDSGNNLTLTVRPYTFNGTTWDRVRGNEEATLLSSSARTTTQTSADITNYNGATSLVVVLDMTTVGTGSVTVSIDGKDTASGKYYNLLTGAAVITNSTNRYRISPNLTAAANSIAQDVLPRIFRIVVTANNANSATYSVGYCLVGR